MAMMTMALALLTNLMAMAPAAALPSEWQAWAPLVGEWVAEPNADEGGFTLAAELQGRVLVRHNVAEQNRARHDDLMVIYHRQGETRADYWDNEGHFIRYAVHVEGPRFVFVSDSEPGAPRFRLTYAPAKAGTMSVLFEMAPAGTPNQFAPYLHGTVRRK